jgi:flagellar hook assembly protein FlgD
MSLTLNTAANVAVNVFNMNGQLVDVLANGQMSSGSYSFTWDGTNASSGVYFIKTQVGSEIHSQKIMLVK